MAHLAQSPQLEPIKLLINIQVLPDKTTAPAFRAGAFFYLLSLLVRISSVRWVFCCLGLALLSACGHTPVTRTLAQAFDSGPNIDPQALNPQLDYLRVSLNGRVALMVLGYREQTPQGPLDTWYSSQGEVLKLHNGRIVSTVGLALDWRDVRYQNLPTWLEASTSTQREFVRVRDQMPSYRFGITEQLAIFPIAAPKDAKLAGVSATQLRWLEEKVLPSPHGLASARFGLHTHAGVTQVIYGEQCLTQNMCIAWQKWPTRL
jgi:hypothetical protein